MLMGAVLIAGSPARISAPAYRVMMDYGGSKIWGIGFLSVSVAIILGVKLWRRQKWLLRWAFLYGAVAYGIFAAEFAITAIQYPDSNLTAMVVYGWVSIGHIVVSDRIRQEAWYWPSLTGRR